METTHEIGGISLGGSNLFSLLSHARSQTENLCFSYCFACVLSGSPPTTTAFSTVERNYNSLRYP